MKENNTIEEESLEDATLFFNSKKLTFSGINAGRYMDEDDFKTYARYVAWQKEKDKVIIDKLKEDNEKLKKALGDILSEFSLQILLEGLDDDSNFIGEDDYH